MFDLTYQEKKAIIFLISLILLSLGSSFALKVNSPVKKFFEESRDINKKDINKASMQDLTMINGIGCKLAEKIIEYRSKYGPFKDLEDLKNVKGIGDFKFNKIKDFLKIR
ncbi:MAG: hypothetical protein DRP74_06210 [Candidatus Omnitrophota bacterium]|nr:MAG: hypothetical protein DRP74_06210 [Candidatus Omnitrophota bacterium]